MTQAPSSSTAAATGPSTTTGGRQRFPVPPSLSPSSLGAFTSCPLAFRFSYVERLPEAPSAPASKGTLVHLALQHLLGRPAPERTVEHALLDLDRAAAEVADHPEFAGLGLTEEEWAGFRAEAEVLVRRYFELEDPREVHAIGLELKVAARIGDVTVRGIIDRLEVAADGEWVISDYKTGSAPSERWEQKSLLGVHVYAMLCEQMLGRRPARVRLIYLSTPEIIVTETSPQSCRGVSVRSTAVMDAVRRACDRGDFRPRASALCNYCSFQEFCPQYGGDPDRAAPVLQARAAEAAGRPQLPLAV